MNLVFHKVSEKKVQFRLFEFYTRWKAVGKILWISVTLFGRGQDGVEFDGVDEKLN